MRLKKKYTKVDLRYVAGLAIYLSPVISGTVETTYVRLAALLKVDVDDLVVRVNTPDEPNDTVDPVQPTDVVEDPLLALARGGPYGIAVAMGIFEATRMDASASRLLAGFMRENGIPYPAGPGPGPKT